MLTPNTDEAAALTEKLEGQQVKLRQKRQEIEDWANRRYQEIEKQAALLVTREQQLDQQEQGYKTSAISWQREREQLQNQIRRLSVQAQRIAAA